MLENYVRSAIGRLNQECPKLDQVLTRLYALLVLVKGEETTLKDVHDAWSVWRDVTHPTHPSLVPFDQLPPEVQALDTPYRDAIARAAMQGDDDA